jgi:cell division protein ZapA
VADKPSSERSDRLAEGKSAAEKPEGPALVHVEIFGQTYAVKAGSDPGYVEKLAASVDEQMKDVSRASGAVDTVRIAVLAALNLADECVRLRRALEEARAQPKASRGTPDDRVRRLAQALDSALEE